MTYTVDTLRDLRAYHPDAELFFITGADALASILSWQDWEELFALAKFVGVSRPGFDLNAEHLAGHLDTMPADAVTLIEIPALAISSTECRRRASEDRPVWYLVPDGVVQYISKRNAVSTCRRGAPRRSYNDVGARTGEVGSRPGRRIELAENNKYFLKTKLENIE